MKMKMKKKLEIKLNSDLCAGVGKHFAAMIDLDTALDDYGIPYIPSSRLKGCMRDAALTIGNIPVGELFGERGADKPGSLRIGNAVIDDYYNTACAVRESGIPSSEITDLFCSTRESTAIDEVSGTAKDKTLRFIRVVNRISPDGKSTMRFFARIEFDDKYKADVEKICKALRNIGYHRNRGLGAVECTLSDYAEGDDEAFCFEEKTFDSKKEYRLECLVRLEGDLMLPANDSSHSLDYIPGTSVLGALAARYGGNNFNDVFLSGKARFGNFYISDYKGNEYVPSPRFLAKIKAAVDDSDKGIKNTLGIETEASNAPSGTPKQYKPLKKGYINSEYGMLEPKRKIVYHNSINTEDGGLYMQYCLCRGQYFKGTITACGSVMSEIYPLFEEGYIDFGKSKTSQYARCHITKLNADELRVKKQSADKNSAVAFVMESDVVVTDESGNYTTDIPELIKLIKSELKLENEIISCFDSRDSYTDKTSAAAKIISGYNAKWNLKKPHITAFSAGGSVIVRMKESVELPEYFFVGEKQNEGFGKIRVTFNADSFGVGDKELEKESFKECALIEAVKRRTAEDEMLRLGTRKAVKISEAREKLLNSSQIGRITLMCKESESFENFEERIKSIKTESVRRAAVRYFSIETVKAELGSVDDWKLVQKYLLNCLTVSKYILKKGEG